MLNPITRAASQAASAVGRTASALGRVTLRVGNAVGSSISSGLQVFGGGLTRAGRAFYQASIHIGHIGYENSAWAVYQTTQQTMPKNWMQKPNAAISKTWGRHLADIALFPLTTLPGWLLGLFALPTLIHSYHSFLSFAEAPQRFVQADLEPEHAKLPKLHGFAYGMPGSVLGLIAGSLIALLTLGSRIIRHTWETTAAIWTQLVNASVQDITSENEVSAKLSVARSPFPQTSFGQFLGIVPLGLVIHPIVSIITLGVIGAGRFALNSGLSIWRNFITGLNLSVYDMYTDNERTTHQHVVALTLDKRNSIQRVLFGWVGEVIGFGFGTLGFVIVGLGRVLINSAESFVRVMYSAIQMALREGSRLHTLFNLPEDRRDESKYGLSKQLGYPGKYGLGLIAMAMGIPTGVLLRLLNETILSAMDAGATSLNLILKDVKGYRPITVRAGRRPYERVIGGLGYPLGTILMLPVTLTIALTRFVITNLDTAQRVSRFFIKTASSLQGPIKVDAVPKTEVEAVPETNENTLNIRNPSQHRTEPTPQEVLLRRIYNWAQTISQQDGRPLYLQVLSFPGALLGTVLGGGVRTLIETSLNSLDSASKLINLSLRGSDYQHYLQPIKSHRNTLEFLLGSPGYVIGFGLAVAPVVSIGLTRWLITNGDTTYRVFVATINQTRREAERLPAPTPDERPAVVRYSTFLGAGVGVLLGLNREVGINSITSLRRQVMYLAKQSLYQSSYEDRIANLTNDDRLLQQKLLGAPGLLFGGLIGSIGYVGISFGRVIGNTAITTYHTVRDMVDLVFLDDYPNADSFAESRRIAAYFRRADENPTSDDNVTVTVELSDVHIPVAIPVTNVSPAVRREDTRQNYPFLLGSFGFVLGGSLGLISAWIAGSARIAGHSLLTAYDTILDFAEAILPENTPTSDYRSPERKPIPKLLGYPFGKIFGVPFGALAWTLILTSRFIFNTGYTTWLVAQAMAWTPPMSDRIPELNDPRSWNSFDRQIGILGYMIGIPFGVIGFVLNYTAHTLYHSAITAYRALFYASLWAIGSTSAKLLLGVNQATFNNHYGEDKRTLFQRYGFGFLGLIGFAVGTGIASVISVFRIAALNVRMMSIGFKRAANLTLEKPHPESSMRLDHEINTIQLGRDITLTDDQLDDAKYTLGIGGLMLGGILGATFVALPVGIIRGLKESVKSYDHLSQSLLNVGLEAPYFVNGVATDKRPAKLKIAGSLGYLIAVMTTGWIPVITFFGKGALIVLALSFSPFVAAMKAGYILFNPRFKKHQADMPEQPAETKMRELYSALVDGEFPAEQSIQTTRPATGNKGAWDFLRKSAQFNLNSLTEDVLQAKLDAIRTKSGQSSLTDETKARIKGDHRSFFFFTTKMRQQHNEIVEQEFENIEHLVDDYLDGHENLVAPQKVNKQASATELFYYQP